jgi:diphthamide synthase (EF-2-diphthine--ammonia ligase)
MTQEVVERIVDETIDTLVDKLDEITVDYMFEYGNYEETDEQFIQDLPVFKRAVIIELYNRLTK